MTNNGDMRYGAISATAPTIEMLDVIPNERRVDNNTDLAKRGDENILQTFTHRQSVEVIGFVDPSHETVRVICRLKKNRQKLEREQ